MDCGFVASNKRGVHELWIGPQKSDVRINLRRSRSSHHISARILTFKLLLFYMMPAYTKDDIHCAHPVTVRDGRVRYNRTLDNYFNVGVMDQVLDSFKPRDNVR